MPTSPRRPLDMRRLLRLLARGLALRCPHCGASFMQGVKLRRACTGCGLRIDRGEEGHFLGSVTFNMVASETVVLAMLVWAVVRWLPATPPPNVYLTAMLSAVLLPVLFYPFSKTLWLAVDLAFRPPGPGDFSK